MDRCDGFLPDGTDCPQPPVHHLAITLNRERAPGTRLVPMHLRLCEDCYAAGGWAHRKPPPEQWTDEDDARR